MKFTLKNRPRFNRNMELQGTPLEEWFEGFEKQIKDSIQYYETMWTPKTPFNKGLRQGLIDKSKEMLGE